jgi:hypothetical protein
MIRFQNKRPGAANALGDKPGGIPEIRKETNLTQSMRKNEADRIISIMRNGKACDFQIAQAHGAS